MAKFCGNCGSRLEDNKCPKCDVKKTTKKEEVEVVSTGKTNGLSIAGFVLSLTSLLLSPLAILGLIFSIIGLVQINKNNEEGKGFAVAGIIVSAVILFFVLMFLLIILFAAMISSTYYY